jgi:plasmid maintenance system antidote protein VapI
MRSPAFAEKLKMTRAAISRVVNGKAGISPEHRVKVKRIHMKETDAAA